MMISGPFLCMLLAFIILSCSSLTVALSPSQQLKSLLERYQSTDEKLPLLLPCCYDGLTARLVRRAGFEATFMTGFGVSAARGHPDTQLISYTEMVDSANQVSEGLQGTVPCIADGDTGYGNAINVKRTIKGYARAGMAGVMMEDQVQPKRCGHVAGKAVVSMEEAVQRIRAACDARDECNDGPLILARTDALKTHGIDEALERLHRFREAGADMTFMEAPRSVQEMERYCNEISGPKLANMLEYGETPILPPEELKKIGYTMAAYPLTLLSASIKAMEESLARIKAGEPTEDLILDFQQTKDCVGFTDYARDEAKYQV